jgi:nicotinic acid phosphoribosyltransferase
MESSGKAQGIQFEGLNKVIETLANFALVDQSSSYLTTEGNADREHVNYMFLFKNERRS